MQPDALERTVKSMIVLIEADKEDCHGLQDEIRLLEKFPNGNSSSKFHEVEMI